MSVKVWLFEYYVSYLVSNSCFYCYQN